MSKQCIYCCEDHLDMAFDDFLVDYEASPELKKAQGQEACTYCSEKAVYSLEKEESIG